MFIDTEASGLPKNWDLPLTADENWPHAMQIAWVIYDENKNEVKTCNYYLENNGFKVQPGALQVHGITDQYLKVHGKPRTEVLQLLGADLKNYQPMLVGHFVQLDYYVLSADYRRMDLVNPLGDLPVFCTMIASKRLSWGPVPRHLRLGELYEALFNAELQCQHNALRDAEATAACFFELQQRGNVNRDTIKEQNANFDKIRQPGHKKQTWFVPALLILGLIILIIYLI